MASTSRFLVFAGAGLLLLSPVGLGQEEPDLGGLLSVGADWAQKNLTPDLLAKLQPPTAADWDQFWQVLRTALDSGSVEDLAELTPYAEVGVKLLASVPGGEDYAAWLQQRLDYFEVARAVVERVPDPQLTAPVQPSVVDDLTLHLTPPARRAPAPRVAPALQRRREQMARSSRVWSETLARRPAPASARDLAPRLKRVFKEEGVPSELVWLAEVESSMNPRARNPGGATGLFQFMPATAQRFGLRIQPVDDRQHPEKSARAAARYLKFLYRQFGSWPLALAGYNAGEGRIRDLLASHSGRSFEDIASFLPVETQMYVPKVLATVARREGIDPAGLPGPVAAATPGRADYWNILLTSHRPGVSLPPTFQAGCRIWHRRNKGSAPCRILC